METGNVWTATCAWDGNSVCCRAVGGLVIINWPDRGKQMKQKIADELKREQMN